MVLISQSFQGVEKLQRCRRYRNINGDDIAVHQWTVIGDAMAEDIVDRCAHRFRKMCVPQRRWICIRADYLIVNEFVEFVGGQTGL